MQTSSDRRLTIKTTLLDRVANIFNHGEVVTIDIAVERTGYCRQTITNALPALVDAKRVWRVAHGKYSLEHRPEGVFEDQDALMAALGSRSVFTARWARKASGLSSPAFTAALRGLLKRGKVYCMRRGVYSK